ncbi:potassium channel family protein [Microbacterium pygmaeum]|uniref:Voltage-gated potassium channel n=1 Tax=Microbacterium pygmaeum TaxID=370764 RepID=A0A1G7V385_9MICO|nr:potassium channel family protein [Microbacterium pygmaeum]SDG54204.1 voltage-gated potassium channel [Microbacterium pygmaeum]
MSTPNPAPEPDPARGETARSERWRQATYWPLAVAAGVFLITYTAHVIGDVRGVWATVTSLTIAIIWVMFIVDYLVRFALSHPRGLWFRTHKADLVTAVIPALRPVRLLDAFTRLASFTKTAGNSIRARLLIYGVGSALLLIWYVALLELQFERHAPGADIDSFGDAVWWAFCTVTTVGYGDFVPVTIPGRVAAVALMVGGVVLVGLVVATISSWVVERASRGHDDAQPASRADIQRLTAALRTAEERVEAERKAAGA